MKSVQSRLLAAALLLAASAPAFAQDTVIVSPQPDTVVIAPEQETVIREYVKREPLASLDLPGIDLTIGNPLPDTVEVRRVESTDYEYTVVGGRTVLVEPGTRRIVRILD